MKYQKLITDLHLLVSNLDYVDLFCMIGSVAAGTETKESDIDFYALLKDIKQKNKFIKAVSKILDRYPSKENYFSYKNKRVSIHIHSTNEINTKVNDLFKNKETFLKNEFIPTGYVAEAIPIYNPKKLLERYRNKIKKYPSKLKKQIIQENIENLGRSIYYLKRGLRSAHYFMDGLADNLRAIYRTIYALNGKYYMPLAKRVVNDLDHLKPSIKKEIDYIVKEPNTPTKMSIKLELLEKIHKKLKNAYKTQFYKFS